MKIITILKEFNIGLDTLNSEIKKLGLSNEFSINSKISKEDCEFLEHLLSNVKKEEKLKDEICKIRENIKGLFLRNISAPQKMGELEKRQLFMCIQSQRIESILMPYFEEYSEENFWSLYNWHIKWTNSKRTDNRDAIQCFIKRTTDFNNLRNIQKEGIIQFINFYEGNTLCKPNSLDFDILIEWYKEWIIKSKDERTKEEELAELELSLKGEKKSNHHKISNDDEEAMMYVLSHGYGDAHGY